MTPPRLHVLVAREAPFAVVLRRGPSKQVASIGWDLRTDTFTLGQWLKGRIYEYRSDLSPDGRHMIYFAMNGHWQGPVKGSWTAVSRAPWLTAVHLYGWGHCWNGGGLFLDNRKYWLNRAGMGDGTPAFIQDRRLIRTDQPPSFVTGARGECPGIYLPKLRRDGWQPAGQNVQASYAEWHFEKPFKAGWTLGKTFHAGVGVGPYGQCYYESHWLEGRGDLIPLERADWADIVRGAIVFARDGALWRQRPNAAGPGEPELIRDFADMVFEPRQAPYSGVETGRRA